MFETITDNKEAALILLFLLVSFKEPLNKVILMVLPNILLHKFGVKIPEKKEKALPKTELKAVNADNGGAVRSEAWHWPEMALVGSSDRFQAWILSAVDTQRKKSERVTFNLINIHSTNARFVAGWKASVLKILQDNSVCVMMVFAGRKTIPSQLKDLKEYVEDEIQSSGKTSIVVREDERRVFETDV